MTLLDSITRTIGGPNPQPQQVQQGTDEEKLTKAANLEQGREQDQSIPAYPHQNEPQETVAEHRTEQVIGREIRPAQRQPIPSMVRQPRPFPAKMMSCTVPDVTGARRMMSKFPRGMTGAPSMFGASPRTTGDFMKFDIPSAIAPKNDRLDPFKRLDSVGRKKKKLPAGMELFSKQGKGKRLLW